jgi:hypothetical protein
MTDKNVKNTVCYVFNKTLSALLTESKQLDSGLKKKISKHKVISEYSNKYIKNMKMSEFRDVISDGVTNEKCLKNLRVYYTIVLGDIMQHLKSGSDALQIQKYLHIFNVLDYLYYLELDSESDGGKEGEGEGEGEKKEGDKESSEELDQHIQKLLEYVLKLDNETSLERAEELLENIMDDDIVDMLKKIVSTNALIDQANRMKNSAEAASAAAANNVNDNGAGQEGGAARAALDPNNPLENMILNSDIGKLAQELAEDDDMKELQRDPQKLLSGDQQALGNVVSTAVSKISQKIQSGELDQQALMKDAFKIMGQLNNMGGGGGGDANPMAQMMQMMQGLQGGGGGNTGATQGKMASMAKQEAQKQRLREKLEKRKKEAN